jgi:hypothetical protein
MADDPHEYQKLRQRIDEIWEIDTRNMDETALQALKDEFNSARKRILEISPFERGRKARDDAEQAEHFKTIEKAIESIEDALCQLRIDTAHLMSPNSFVCVVVRILFDSLVENGLTLDEAKAKIIEQADVIHRMRIVKHMMNK